MNIIDGLQKKHVKIAEKMFTTAAWAIMLIYIIQVILSILLWIFNLSNFYHKLFILGNIKNTISTLAATIIFSLSALIAMYIWGKYNFRRYAGLNRRKFPENVSACEIADYFELPISLVEQMQKDREMGDGYLEFKISNRIK